MLRSSCTWLFIVAGFLQVNYVHAALFSDTEFNDGNWTIIEVRDDGSVSTGTGAQKLSGGNLDAYRQGENILGGPTTVRYAHMYSSAYDPSLSGAIASLDWSYDFIALAATNPTNGAIASNILIEQEGIFYIAGPGLTLPVDPAGPPPIWTTNSGLDYSASNFTAVDSTGNPDFSATGGIISLGWLTSNSTGQAPPGRIATWGLDNWQFDITPKIPPPIPEVPVPAAFWLFGTALLGFIGVSRRRKVA